MTSSGGIAGTSPVKTWKHSLFKPPWLSRLGPLRRKNNLISWRYLWRLIPKQCWLAHCVLFIACFTANVLELNECVKEHTVEICVRFNYFPADEPLLVSTPIKVEGIDSHTSLCTWWRLCRSHVIDGTRLYTYFIGTCIFYGVILGTPLLCSRYVRPKEDEVFFVSVVLYLGERKGEVLNMFWRLKSSPSPNPSCEVFDNNHVPLSVCCTLLLIHDPDSFSLTISMFK